MTRILLTVVLIGLVVAFGLLLLLTNGRRENRLLVEQELAAREIPEATGPDKTITFRLPRDVKKDSLKGLSAKVEVLETDAKEGYVIEIYAATNATDAKSKAVKLGEKVIFKPLVRGEQTTIYLDVLPADAWQAGDQLWLFWEIAGARPQRTPPTVTLKITSVAPRLRDHQTRSDQ